MSASAHNQIADYLVYGEDTRPRKWDSNTITINYSGVASNVQWMVQRALDTWESVTGLEFVWTHNALSSDILFYDDFSGAYSQYGWSNTSTLRDMRYAEVNVSKNWIANYGIGIDTYSFQTYLHEIGHAIGLGHPGPYNGAGVTYGTHAIFSNDSWQASLMSYFTQGENPNVNASTALVITPMIADVLAMWELYGKPNDIRTGDTFYGWGSTAGGVYDQIASIGNRVAFNIVDDGGWDVINFWNDTNDQYVSLYAEQYSNVYGLVGNMAIMRGTVIEHYVAGQGNDTVYGNTVDNVLYGLNGNDTLWGGSGNDKIYGGSGNDFLVGDAGNDHVIGEDGDDQLAGAGGADWVVGGNGNDRMWGNAGNDYMEGRAGDDYLEGGDDNDTLFGGGGNDTLWGGSGNDRLYGGVGNDFLVGDEGNDHVIGEDGDDQLAGADGADWVVGGNGNDRMWGNAGNDYMEGRAGDDYLDGGDNDDTLFGGGGNDQLAGGAGSDVIYGDAGVDVAWGGAGNDRLNGGADRDWLFGQADNDILNGGAGNDVLSGGAGSDEFVFNTNHGNDTITDYVDGQDTLIIQGGSFASLSITQNGSDALINTGTGTILLVGVQITDLTTDDFQFI